LNKSTKPDANPDSNEDNDNNIEKQQKSKNRKPKLPEESEPIEESEYNLQINKNDSDNIRNGKLRLEDLVKPLEKTTSKDLNAIIRNLKKEKSAKTLHTPLPTHSKEKLDRTIGYQLASDQVSVWEPWVKNHRESPVVSFRPEKCEKNIAGLAATFKPTNDIEKDFASLLKTMGVKEDDMSKKETEQLKEQNITEEEIRRREGQLAKMKASLYYEGVKQNRIAKIKSKIYRKLRNKRKKRKVER